MIYHEEPGRLELQWNQETGASPYHSSGTRTDFLDFVPLPGQSSRTKVAHRSRASWRKFLFPRTTPGKHLPRPCFPSTARIYFAVLKSSGLPLSELRIHQFIFRKIYRIDVFPLSGSNLNSSIFSTAEYKLFCPTITYGVNLLQNSVFGFVLVYTQPNPFRCRIKFSPRYTD